MVVSAIAFSLMNLQVKVLGQRLPSQEVVLARALMSVALAYMGLRRAGISPWGSHRVLLVLRGVVGVASLSCIYYSMIALPLAEATVIYFLHPVIATSLALLLLGERIGGRVALALGLGLAGVLVVARPSFLFGQAGADLPALGLAAAIGSAVLAACAYLLVRRLSRSEHPLVIVFYFPLVAFPTVIPWVVPVFVWPRGWEWLLLVGVGVAAHVGQVALTLGMRVLPVGPALNYTYGQVVFASLWGWLVFSEIPGAWTLMGTALILAGSLLAGPRRAPG